MRSFFDARSALLLAGIATFILMGAGQAIFGPALPAYERVYGLTTAEAGWLISAFWVGCVVGVPGMYVFGHTVTPRSGLAMLPWDRRCWPASSTGQQPCWARQRLGSGTAVWRSCSTRACWRHSAHAAPRCLERITFNLIQIEGNPRQVSRWLCCVSPLIR